MARDMTTITQARIKTLEKANEKLRTENTRLDSALLATSNELTDATAQINELNEENRRLLAELEAARARLEYNENKMRELNNELAKALGLTF